MQGSLLPSPSFTREDPGGGGGGEGSKEVMLTLEKLLLQLQLQPMMSQSVRQRASLIIYA